MTTPHRGRLAVLALLCAGSLAAQTPRLRVLFLGNSLTESNNLPALVQGMAAAQGVQIDYEAITPGGVDLSDHWNSASRTRLQTGDFDVLILQQGPSTLPSSQDHLRQWAMTWADEARRFGAEPALYMVWAPLSQANGFELSALSYRNAATAANATVFPAGEVLQRVRNRVATIPLFSSDAFHPAQQGSFLAAMVIARGLVGLDPARVPNLVTKFSVPNATLEIFRAEVGNLTAASFVSPQTTPPPATTPPASTPPATNPPPAAAASSSGGGGGGAPSAFFVVALLLLGAARYRTVLR